MEETFLIHYLKHIVLKPKPNRQCQERKLQINLLHEHRYKNVQQNIRKSNPAYIKKKMYSHSLLHLITIPYSNLPNYPKYIFKAVFPQPRIQSR